MSRDHGISEAREIDAGARRCVLGDQPRGNRRGSLVFLVLSVVVPLLCIPSCASRQPTSNRPPRPDASAVPSASPERFADPLLAEFLQDPMQFYFDLRVTEILECGQKLLRRDHDFTPRELRDGLTALAAMYVSTRREPQARAAFLQLLADDPAVDLGSPDLLPPPVVGLFYGIRDSLFIASDRRIPPDPRTVAIGPIRNTSIFAGEYDLDRFARGLRHIITIDLMDVTPLRIVDRQRLEVISAERRLSGDLLAGDSEFWPRVRRLTGADSYIFGTIMQTNERDVRLDLRWAQTETGEVLLSEGLTTSLRSSDDLFKLERKVLIELLIPGIHELLSASDETREMQERAKECLKQRRRKVAGDTAYIDLLLTTGDALLAEVKGDYATAIEAWDRAREINPGDRVAMERAKALSTHVAFAEE